MTLITFLASLVAISSTLLGATVAATNRRVVVTAQTGAQVVRDERGRVHIRLARGGKVELDNRTTGRIVVMGWDHDYIEAEATSARGAEHVEASSDTGFKGQWVRLKADYKDEPWLPRLKFPELSATPSLGTGPSSTTSAKNSDAGVGRQADPDEVHLLVKLPRYAELDMISVNRSEVEITGLTTPVAVSGRRSAIKLMEVGAVEVRNERGSVEVDGAAGLVDVVTSSGPVRVRNVRGDVRVISLSGQAEIACVRGRVNVSNTEGTVALFDVDGDVDATTVNSVIKFAGPLRPEGRYHLKSMSGDVEMGVRRNPPGFTALLSSYRGTVDSDFNLDSRQQPKDSQGTRRFSRHGDGRAQITLDSFDGRVRLSKLQSEPPEACR